MEKHVSKENRELAIFLVEKGHQDVVIRAILKECDDDFIQFIGEVALNVLKGTLKISSHYKSKLKDSADFIRRLGSKGVKPTARRKLILKEYKTVLIIIKAIKKHMN